jgi:hypothetical protein
MRVVRRRGHEWVRLGLLLAVLAGLAAYAATTGVALPWSGGGVGAGSDCPSSGAPELATVSRAELGSLRDELSSLVASDPGLRPYEAGPTTSASPWSDGEPGGPGPLPPQARQPGGYELRWWLPNRDDVGVDGYVFAGPEEARDFLERASSGDCRSASVTHRTAVPPGGRNLAWDNPDGFAQEDLFLRRGRRVYRVAVVVAGAGRRPRSADMTAGFSLVDGLACRLPGAGCGAAGGVGRSGPLE